MKLNSLSPEFHDWLHTGLGEAMEEDFESVPAYGTDAFDERMERLADEERFHPIDRPDERYGIDVYFIADFITPEMQPAFRTLAKEFLRKEELLSDPESRTWLCNFVYPYRKEQAFTDAYDFRVLGMILLCAEHGSAYSREILISLYKTFYRKEYNILKRMKTLSLREAMDAFSDREKEGIYGDPDEEDRFDSLPRVFVIADLMGIELDRMWNRILQIMNDEYKRDITVWNMIHIASHDSGVVSRRREQEEEARKFLTDHFPDMEWIDMDFFDAEDERYQILDGVKNLIEGTFDEIGAGTEALFRDRQFVLFYNAYKAMCSSVRKMDEEDLEQITLLAVIRYLSAALARLITIHNSELNELLRIEFRDVVDPEEIRELTDHRLTDGDLKAVRMAMQGGSVELLAGDERSGKLVRSLESIRQRGQGKETIKKQKKQEQILLVEVDEKDERIRLLEEELAESRRQLAVAQNDIRAQRSLYEEQREYSDVLKRQAEERRKEHAELLTLRQFVHQLDSPDISEDKIPDSDKIERLRKHKIAIVGGHENWIKKMRRILPEWTYIGASDSISVDSAVTSVEKIYFYTDIMSHKMYYKFMKAAQDNKRPFGYLHGTNISGIVNALYEELPGQ